MQTNKIQVETANAPSPAGPYSQGIVTEQFVFVAGQRPQNPVTGEFPQGIKEQTRQVIENIEGVLKASGSSLDKIVRSNVYLADIGMFDEMNEVYSEMMPKPYPVRTTIGAQLRGILVEIEVIALRN